MPAVSPRFGPFQTAPPSAVTNPGQTNGSSRWLYLGQGVGSTRHHLEGANKETAAAAVAAEVLELAVCYCAPHHSPQLPPLARVTLRSQNLTQKTTPAVALTRGCSDAGGGGGGGSTSTFRPRRNYVADSSVGKGSLGGNRSLMQRHHLLQPTTNQRAESCCVLASIICCFLVSHRISSFQLCFRCRH